jgi:hypothetical protein
MPYYIAECAECGAAFTKHRIDKQCCSKACLMRRYRRVQNDRIDRIESAIERLTGQEPKITRDLFA